MERRIIRGEGVLAWLVLGLTFFCSSAGAQTHKCTQSRVMFFSDAAIEDISAVNVKSAGLYNDQTGEIVFSIPVNQFTFHKKLMQEHFNEKYMESEKYPKATFQGTITRGEGQKATAIGKMTIHGVAKDVQITGTLEPAAQTFVMKAKFIIRLEDYSIKIPQVLWQNIAEQVEVTCEFTFNPYEK